MRLGIVVVLMVAAFGCGGVAGSAGGGSPNVINTEQLRELDVEGLTVVQVIQRLRPTWLRVRGATTLSSTAPNAPRVVVNGAPLGELSQLDGMTAREVEAIEFVGASDATTRFGTGYTGGAILVRTR